jgi:acyl carrier protein
VSVGAVPATHAEMLGLLREELRAVNGALAPDLAADKELVSELGIDSLDVVEFVARLEYRFRFVVPDDEWQELATLDAIADYALTHVRS